LGATSPEAYEVANGMVPRWIDIDAAIAHNERILGSKPAHMGLSIARETWMLRYALAMVAAGAAVGER
jgi:hypothetical protein